MSAEHPAPTRREFLSAGAAALGGALALGPDLLAEGSGGAPQAIPTRPIPGTAERLPIVGLGSSKAVLEIPREGVEPLAAVMRRLLARGGRVVDTSVRTEEIDQEFGRLLQREEFRDPFFLTAKVNTEDARTGVAQFRQTQRLFGRRTFDLVQIESLRGLAHHWPRLLEWRESGEARYIGVTVQNEGSYRELETFLRREDPDFVHVNYSVLETSAEERILPLAQDRGLAVLINRPFTNGTYFGRVAGRALPAWVADFDCHAWSHFSLKYILANPAVTCVLTETTNPEHLDENLDAAFGRFPDEAARRRMRELARTF